jgi:hypothetical protein
VLFSDRTPAMTPRPAPGKQAPQIKALHQLLWWPCGDRDLTTIADIGDSLLVQLPGGTGRS